VWVADTDARHGNGRAHEAVFADIQKVRGGGWLGHWQLDDW